MSSPHPKRAEIGESSGTVVVSETESAVKSHKQDMIRRKKETRQSPFKVPDSKSIFQLSINEKQRQKEEMRKFLALPIDKKTTHAARMMAKMKKDLVGKLEEEVVVVEKEKMKNLKKNKIKTTFPKQTPGRHELKMVMMKQESITKDSKHDLISMERKKAVLELSILTKKDEILRIGKAIAEEEQHLKRLELVIARENLMFEEFLRENERKSVEARTLFEQEAKSKQEKNAEIKKLTAEIGTIKSEIAKYEETLIDYKRYKELLFKLSPPEWQEAQKAKALKAKVLKKNKDTQKCDLNENMCTGLEIEESAGETIRETGLPSAHSNTVLTNSDPDSDSSEYEDEPELYFSDPQQLLDVMTELIEQNLSLIQNSTRVEVTMEGLRQSLETTRNKIEKVEEELTLQINDITEKIDTERARGNKLKQNVHLHVSLNIEDQDIMLNALGEKVSEVHRCCVDDRMTNLSTLEKLVNIEDCMSVLLQGLESLPEQILEMIKRIKDSEMRVREREEKLRKQREKQQEKMRKYMERSLADSKKTSGRKLMPRCMPVAPKVEVRNVDNIPAEDELHAYLFVPED